MLCNFVLLSPAAYNSCSPKFTLDFDGVQHTIQAGNWDGDKCLTEMAPRVPFFISVQNGIVRYTRQGCNILQIDINVIHTSEVLHCEIS